ncbi:MAG: hypothetical protein H6R19_3088 [Proteobacteria bacterium]|nr:hypothetical protein [Pseudomonadota bacterium]
MAMLTKESLATIFCSLALGALYAIEENVRGKPPEIRQATRQAEAIPAYVLERIADTPITRVAELLPWNYAAPLSKTAG